MHQNQITTDRHDGLFLLPEPLLAEEDDGGLEDEAHGVQLQPLLDLPQEVGDVEPLHAAVVQEVAGAQVDALQRVEKRVGRILEAMLKDKACVGCGKRLQTLQVHKVRLCRV